MRLLRLLGDAFLPVGLLISLAATRCSGAYQIELSSSPATSWSLRNGQGTHKGIPASVPGSVHLDLLAARILEKGDPLYRYNEVEYQWVTEETWCYSVDLPPLPNDQGSSSSLGPWLLRLQGVDTIAEVRLNGAVIGNTDNFFMHYTFELPDGLLKPNDQKNVLEVEIQPSRVAAAQRRDLSTYPIPETTFVNTWTNDSGRNFIRKPASDWGWDWGPAFVPAGIPGSVSLTRLGPYGEISDVLVSQTHDLSQGAVSLEIVSYIERVQAPSSAVLTIALGTQSVQVPVSLEAGDNKITHTLVVDKPELWWPVGMVAKSSSHPRLYDLEVVLQGGADSGKLTVASTKSRRIGLRTVELVEEKVPDSEGLSFYFKVNGQPVFARGANLIPFSVFGDHSEEDMDWTLQSAVESNMNMIRVWGGGYYMPDKFYDLCDEKGLLVWQEIMLACALYPRTEDFLSNVRTEITQQVRRLQAHPSIALWGGSNENEAALSWYEPSLANRDLYAIDFSILYVETVYPIVAALDPNRAWVDSSPSNGLVSKSPYVKRWGDPYSALYGDLHYYDYYKDCEIPDNFPSSRFVSEFGFQSLPSLETYRKVLAPDDLRRDSDVLEFRQRHGDGNQQLEHMIGLHFPLPPVTAQETSVSQEKLMDAFIYLTQIQQARCVETGMNKWRRAKTTSDKTMGILYWQLNDLWQGPSWASMEYGGKWKALQYVVKRAYAPLLLSSYIDNSSVVHVHLTSDLPFEQDKVEGILTVELHSLSSTLTDQTSPIKPLQSWAKEVSVTGGGSKLLSVPVREFLGGGRYSQYDTFLHLSFQPSDDVPSCTSDVFFSTFKESTLVPAVVTVRGVTPLPSGKGLRLMLSSNAVAPYVWLEATGIPGYFSDNAFLALPGHEYSVDFVPRQPSSGLTVEQLTAALSVQSLWDAVAPSTTSTTTSVLNQLNREITSTKTAAGKTKGQKTNKGKGLRGTSSTAETARGP